MVLLLVAENHTQFEMQNMRRACPVTCQSDTYEARLSWAAFPAPQILQDLQDNFNMSSEQVRSILKRYSIEHLVWCSVIFLNCSVLEFKFGYSCRKNLLQLTIYFEDLGIHKKEQQPAYTGASLFGKMPPCFCIRIQTHDSCWCQANVSLSWGAGVSIANVSLCVVTSAPLVDIACRLIQATRLCSNFSVCVTKELSLQYKHEGIKLQQCVILWRVFGIPWWFGRFDIRTL